MFKFFDSHCHPQLSAFDVDREAVLARMQEGAVAGLVVGVDLETSRGAIELARSRDFLWAAVGLHPNDNPGEIFDGKAFLELARDSKVVAIGECGLDFFRGDEGTVETAQRERFLKHVALALEVQKPLMIHCRPTAGTQNAHEEMLSILAGYAKELEGGALRVVIHFFTSTKDIAEKYLALGCYLSFPGVITFTDMYDDAVCVTPLDKLLSETDSPFAAPMPHRGARNEPSFVIETVRRLAELKSASFEDMGVQIAKNASTFFGLGA